MKIHNLKKTIEELEGEGFLAWTKNVFKIDGAEMYLVGGAVRDLLLGKKDVKDFDFVVRRVAMDKLEEALEVEGKVNLVGKNFGVIKFIPNKKKMSVPFDIALPRTEVSKATGGYHDFDVSFDPNLPIKEDLGRRDFTVNALAYKIDTGEIVDEFEGLKDLEQEKIVTVGNAHERFDEDYSRMLRGLRFACQLGWQIEESTWEAIQKNIIHINDERNGERVVPYEVIANEFLKAFVSEPVRAFDLYDKSGTFKELVPEVLKMKKVPQPENWHSEGDVWEHTRLALKNLTSETFKERFKKEIIFKKNDRSQLVGAELMMATLFHDIGKPETIETPEEHGTDRLRFNNHDDKGAKIARKICERLKLSATSSYDFDPERMEWLIAHHHLYDTKILESMKNSTIEKYFFSDRYSGEDLLKLGFVDQLASLRLKTGEGDTSNVERMIERIEELKKMGKGKNLPKPFLNGDEVMKALGIGPGVKVGEMLDSLREKQLDGEIKNKEQAIEYINEL